MQEFIEECPKELLDVFNGPSNLLQLPSIESSLDDWERYVVGEEIDGIGAVHYRFKNELFSAPITRVTVKSPANPELRTLYILFKIKNI